MESGSLEPGDDVLITGPSTGVVEETVREVRLEYDPVPRASKGDLCSIPVSAGKVRRGDKVYIWNKLSTKDG